MGRSKGQNPTVRRIGKGKRQKWWAEWHVYVEGQARPRHRSGTFGLCSEKSRQDAQAECDKLVQQETRGIYKPAASGSLNTFWITTFLPVRSRAWSYNTRRAMEGTYAKHIHESIGQAAITDITKSGIEQHLLRMSDAQCSYQLVDRVRVILHAVLDEALENDLIGRNPARKVSTPACKAARPTRSLTEDEVRCLFERTSGWKRLLWRILILTGVRIGEALVLSRDDVEDGVLRIDESALNGQRAATKNKKVRYAPLPLSLQQEIKARIAELAAEEQLLFPTRVGNIRRRQGLAEMLEATRKLTGIADLTFRMCRTTCATLNEGDISDVQDMLGHHSSAFTMRHYKRAIPERAMRSIEELDRRLSGKRAEIVEIRREA